MTEQQAMRMALEALENSIDLVMQDAYNAEQLYGNYPARQAKVGGLKLLAEDHQKAITALRQALEQRPAITQDWSVFNTGAEVASGLTFDEAWEYMTPERLERGWSAVCVINKDNPPLYTRPQPAEEPVAIKWEKDADKECGYNNWVGITPFGQILITWKGWKEYHDACVDEFPGDFQFYGSPDEVKAACEAEYLRRINTRPKPAYEPVAWTESDWHYQLHKKGMVVAHKDKGDVLVGEPQPLYTRPQSAAWVDLTDEEFEQLLVDAKFTRSDLLMLGACVEDICNMVQAKLKEKNT